MMDGKKVPEPKQLRTVFVSDSELPTHFINAINVHAGMEEFYFTLGTATPLEVTDIRELENIETINAHPAFRFVITRTTMKQMIDVMKSVYDVQTQQIDMIHISQEEVYEDGTGNTV